MPARHLELSLECLVPWRSPLQFPSQPWGLLSQWYLSTPDLTVLHLRFVVLEMCMYTIPSLCITASTPSAWILYCLPDAAEKVTTKLGAFNISNFLILDFIISQKSKPICGRGGSPGGSVGEGFHASFLASGSCQKSLVYPGLGLRTPISAPSLCGLLLVSASYPPSVSYWDTGHCF